MEKKRVLYWDNLKLVAILCIVWFHSTTTIDGMPYLKYVHPILNYYSMTLFAIISGYWYKDKSFKEMALLYLWPCILFSIINNILGSNSYFPNDYPNSDYWTAFRFKPGPAMWYLLALFIYAIATKCLRKYIGCTCYLFFAFIIAVTIGFLPIPNRIFDIQRISCLFPVYVFGLWIKENADNQLKTIRTRGKTRVLCAIILLLCILYSVFIIHYNSRLFGYFPSYYGLNMKAALAKWIMMTVRVVACMCLIVLMPNKEFRFTKYGSRTMNVYLLHDTIIFLTSWGILYNYRHEWYGIMSCILFVPLLCTLLFSAPVDKFMKRILFSDYIQLIKEKTRGQRQ